MAQADLAQRAPVSNRLLAANDSLWSSGPQMWCKHAGSVIDAIRINAISREVRDGRPLLIKRRRLVSLPLARTANLFFRAARHPDSPCSAASAAAESLAGRQPV